MQNNILYLNQWFDDIKPWDVSCLSTGRIVWINIEGVPVLARNHKSILSLAFYFGEVLEVGKFDFNSNFLETAKALVFSKDLKEVNFILKALLNGFTFDVKDFEDRFSPSLLFKSQSHVPNSWDSSSIFTLVDDEPGVKDT
nr:nucleotide-binding alpha-beta plait domain-containing protein [Tanacetum cinerariifolium]